jgi:hypothetical protein
MVLINPWLVAIYFEFKKELFFNPSLVRFPLGATQLACLKAGDGANLVKNGVEKGQRNQKGIADRTPKPASP